MMYGIAIVMLITALICVEAQDWTDVKDYENRNIATRTR